MTQWPWKLNKGHKHEKCLVPDNCTKYEQNHHIRLWDITTLKILLWNITTNTANLWKNGYNYSNVAHRHIIIYKYQQPMVPYHGTQYDENPSNHRREMHKDWGIDWTFSYIPQFHLGGAENNKVQLI